MALSKAVVAEDKKLAKASDKAGEALMKHRWHWTLDESNAKRVSFAEYARQVGRHESIVRRLQHSHYGRHSCYAGAIAEV